jgi:nitrite reductase/ring-hydroxylating ferredoxin subunit
VGRVEQLPRKGSYFTKELAVARTSVVIVRGTDDEIRAFHNVCRHRGNKLVWNDFPGEEVKGTCRQFQCKYHAWRYSLEGDLTFIQQEHEFFGVDKSAYGLKTVRCEVWEGFIFVNLDPDAAPLSEYLGEYGQTLAGYPFGEMTEVYTYKAEINSNWKLFIDAFAEFYHAPILHAKQSVSEESEKLVRYGYEGLHYDLKYPHGMVSSWGGMSPPKDLKMVKPIERILEAGLFGPWKRPDIDGLDELPPGINPSRHPKWGIDSFHFFPNFMLLFWAPGWYLTYDYWPTGPHSHVFETSLYFVPAKTAAERLAHELAAVTFKEYGLQDANTLEATQRMLNSGVVTEFPLCDQEILPRALHNASKRYVKEHANG